MTETGKHGKGPLCGLRVKFCWVASRNHDQNFVLAALGEEKCRWSFDVAGSLNQVYNLGLIAQELGLEGETLAFDPQIKRFVDHDGANELLVGPPPRAGWEPYYER